VSGELSKSKTRKCGKIEKLKNGSPEFFNSGLPLIIHFTAIICLLTYPIFRSCFCPTGFLLTSNPGTFPKKKKQPSF
jgi:hypothetical protein